MWQSVVKFTVTKIMVTKTLKWQTDIGNNEIGLRDKFFCLDRVFGTADRLPHIYKKKLGNQEEVLHGGINLIYLPFLIKGMETMPQSYQQSTM